MSEDYQYSSNEKTLLSIPLDTVHMIVNCYVEGLGPNVSSAAKTTLERVTFLSPSNLKSLDQATFFGCIHLTEIDFRNCTMLYSILSFTFNGCTSLETVYFPDSLNYFDTECFIGTKLKTFVIPSNLIRIGSRSFKNVATLVSLDFSKAFNFNHFYFNCLEGTNIQYLDLRNCSKLAYLEDNCFSNCHSLKYVYFPCLNQQIQFGALCFFNCTSLENVYFTRCSKILLIPASTFNNCHKLILPYGIRFHFPISNNKKCQFIINHSLMSFVLISLLLS